MNSTKKIILLFIIAALTLTTLAGCQSAAPQDPIKDLAEHEKKWLAELEPLTDQIDNVYRSWSKGEIDRKKLNTALNEIYTDYQKINREYQEYRQDSKLSQEEKDKPVYKEGLINGKNLRDDVNDFLLITAQGVENPETKERVPLNNAQVQFFYKQKMLTDYNIHIYALKNALQTFEQSEDKNK